MHSQFEIIVWITKNAGMAIKDHAEYYIDDPRETTGGIWDWIKREAISMYKTVKNGILYMIENPRETLSKIWNWIKRNKWKILVVGGILVIVIPLAVGFAPGGIVAGSLAAAWQSSIGAVAAGSAFAALQSLAMTGVFMGVGAALIGLGGLAALPTLLANLQTPDAALLPELVRQWRPIPTPTDAAISAWPAGGEPLVSLKATGTLFWKWLAGRSETPPEMEDTGIRPEEARTMVLSLLACDEELPSLLHDADITQEERDSIWEALAALHVNGLRDAEVSAHGSNL